MPLGYYGVPTGRVGCLKALLLHRVIGEEAHEQLVAAGRDGRRPLGAAEAAQTRRFPISTVVNLDVVVSALEVSLHVKFVEAL